MPLEHWACLRGPARRPAEHGTHMVHDLVCGERRREHGMLIERRPQWSRPPRNQQYGDVHPLEHFASVELCGLENVYIDDRSVGSCSQPRYQLVGLPARPGRPKNMCARLLQAIRDVAREEVVLLDQQDQPVDTRHLGFYHAVDLT